MRIPELPASAATAALSSKTNFPTISLNFHTRKSDNAGGPPNVGATSDNFKSQEPPAPPWDGGRGADQASIEQDGVVGAPREAHGDDLFGDGDAPKPHPA